MKTIKVGKPNNLLCSLVLCFSMINGAVGINGISAVTVGVIWLLYLLTNKNVRNAKETLIILGGILLLFVVSFVRASFTNGMLDNTLTYFLYFLAFGIIAYLVGLLTIEVSEVLKIMSIIGLICAIVTFFRGYTLFEGTSSSKLMGIAYSFLPAFFASVLGVRHNGIWRWISAFSAVTILILLVDISPRGVWMVTIVFLFFYIYNLISRSGTYDRRIIKKYVFLFVAVLIVIFAMVNLTSIILWVKDFLGEFDISIYALDKYLFYLSRDNLSNGRDLLWEQGWVAFSQNVITGCGVGYVETKYGAAIHNIFLQAGCEGGICLLIVVAIIVVKALLSLLDVRKPMEQNEYMFQVLVFCCGVVHLMFSSVYWILIPFWYFLGRYTKTVFLTKRRKF